VNKTKKLVSAALLMCIVVLVSVGSAAAMTAGNQNGDLDREQLKDGSCCDCDCVGPLADQQQDRLQDQTKSQLKDGSCGDCVDPVADKQQDMLREQTRDQLKDGSCCVCVGKL